MEDVFKDFITHCRSGYDWVDDDVEDYQPGWVLPKPNETLLYPEISPWIYRNSFELKNAPYLGLISNYKGGGYTFTFMRTPEMTLAFMDEAERMGWLDPRTRAVFVEFTLYNANVNLFASVIMLLEFMDTGGAIPKPEVKVS